MSQAKGDYSSPKSQITWQAPVHLRSIQLVREIAATSSLIVAHVDQGSPDNVTNKIMAFHSDGKIEIGLGTNLYRSGLNTLKTDNQSSAAEGMITKTKAGAITDADFVTIPPDGTIAIDTVNSRLYVRIAGTWKSVGLS